VFLRGSCLRPDADDIPPQYAKAENTKIQDNSLAVEVPPKNPLIISFIYLINHIILTL
jgi:hypothetical protein